MSSGPNLLTTAQVCERLGVTSSTVARWVAAGKLTETVKLPGPRGARLFAERDVARFEKASAS